MFSYESFINKMQRFSEEKVKYVVYGNVYEHIFTIIIVFLLFFNFLNIFIGKYSRFLYYFLFFIGLIILMLYLSGKKAGLALTENRIVYVKFGLIGFKEKEVYEILYSSIKYITVRKILFFNTVNVSFISNDGKFKKIKVLFSSFMIGKGFNKYKNNSKQMYDELKQIQKVIDKGDF